MNDEASDLDRPAEAIRLLHEFAQGLTDRGVLPDRCADWEAVLLRLESLLLELRGECPCPDETGHEPAPTSPLVRDGYLITDQLGVILEANHTAADLLGTRREFVLGKPLPLYLAEGHLSTVYALLGQKRASAAIRDWQARLRPGRRGSPGPLVSITMMPVAEVGRPPRLRWLLRDRSQGGRSGRALLSDRTAASNLIDAAPALVLLLDGRGTILRCNQLLQAATGRSEDELLGRDWLQLLVVPDHSVAREALWQALAHGVSRSFVGGLHGALGPSRVVAWSAKAVPLGETPGAALLVLGHDIDELQEAQNRALRAERLAAIGEMTAALTHESRNLLQSSQACLERLSWRLEDRPEVLDLVARIRQAHASLARLFDDVRLYAAPLRLELGPCHLGEVWRDAWTSVRAALPDRQGELHEETGDLDLWCTADRFRLGQVFRNILENSFAACTGPVRVEVRCRQDDLEGRPALCVAVRDNGPGLDAEQRRRIFEPFYTTRPRGSGLGMAIARRVLESHAGKITVGDGSPGAEILLFLPRHRT